MPNMDGNELYFKVFQEGLSTNDVNSFCWHSPPPPPFLHHFFQPKGKPLMNLWDKTKNDQISNPTIFFDENF